VDGAFERYRDCHGYEAVIDKDHVVTFSIDKIGHPTTATGQRLDDLVADITVGDQRFGMRQCTEGQLGPTWVIVGPPYDEPLVV
jgi:hypothetical protein